MTQVDKDRHQYTFHRFQMARENYYTPKFNKAIQLQVESAVNQLKQGERIPFISSEPILQVLKPLYTSVAIVYGAKVLAEIKTFKARMPIGFSERMLMLIQQYYGLDFLNLSENITDTLRDYIQEVLVRSYPLGLGIDDIIAQLRDTQLTRARARLIARTETVAAANAGGLIVAKDTGMNLNKVWIAARDKRTRRSHILAQEQKVDVDGYFLMGGYQLKVPGDKGGKDGQPRVPAKEVINCRCAAVYEKPSRSAFFL